MRGILNVSYNIKWKIQMYEDKDKWNIFKCSLSLDDPKAVGRYEIRLYSKLIKLRRK